MRKLLALFFFIIVFVDAMAQVPQKISYQAVVRNTSNALIVNQTIGLRVSIVQGSILGTAVYVERQSPTTNASGVISIQIGANPLGLSFSSINWINGPFYLKTEIDPTGGNNYTISGISELLSVPYSLYAQNAFTVNGLVAVINGGTGAKTPTLARVNLGLGNVDNTRDVDKPISKKVQTALNSKANLEDPVFTGIPEAPTANVGTNTNQIANTYFVNDAIKRATPDATETVKGLIRLNGDLTGTALLPIIRDKKITTNKLADSAVTTSKIYPKNVTTESLADSSVTAIKIKNLNVTTAKLANDAVTTSKILDANITTAKLADSSVTNAKFKDNSINTIKIADSAINTNKIRNLNVTTVKIADSAVTSNKLRNLNVTTEKLADDAVTTAKILDANITTEKLADSSVTNAKFKDNSINTIKIADSAITTNKIRNLNVTTAKLADNAVTTAKIQDANVTTEKVLDSAIITTKIKSLNVTTAKIADSAVTTTKLKNLNVTTAKIADNAVTTTKILDANVTTEKVLDSAIITSKIKSLNVTTAKLADSAVTTTKLKNLNVTTAKLSDSSIITSKIKNLNVTTVKLADSAVTTIKIADNAVTNAKIFSVDQSKITGIILGAIGGTGVANTGKTITLGGNLTTSGAFATTLVSTAATNITLPTTGTLATLAGTETFTNKTITAGTNTISGLTNTNLSGTAGITDANLATITSAGKVTNSATTATNLNTNNAIVARDASGNFSAGTITATLNGNATNVSGIVLGTNGGTGIANTGKTITLGGNLTTSGAFATTLVSTAATNVTLPTTGTLASLAGTEIFTNKTITAGTNTISGLTNANLSGNAGISIANGGTGANTVIGAKTNLILDQVDNTKDLNKPISTATQAALDLKAPLASPNLTGIPTAPTAAFATNTTQIATTEFVMANASTLDATTTTKGKLKLAGDLTGTADLPFVAAGAIDDSKISNTAAIADTKLATISTAGKVTNSATTATSGNTNNAIVARDATGNFSANTITASLNGNATNVTGIVLGANGGTGIANTGKTITLGGNLTTSGAFATTLVSTAATNITLPTTGTLATLAGTETLTGKIIAASSNTITGLTNTNLSGTAGITDANLANITSAGKVANSATTATSGYSNNTIVARDASGNFAANNITADLTGNASGTAANVTGIVLGANGGTGVANTGKTITLDGNLTTSGAFATTLVSTAATNITLPTIGTLATLAGIETLTGKTIAASSNTITGLTNTNLSGSAGITDDNLATITTAGKIANSATSATNTNTINTIVSRDASGNFSANTITATLNGNATNVTGIVLGTNGGTGIANAGKTITLGGNLTTSGAFATTLVSSAATNVTLPTTGTLATLAGTETLTGKTIAASSNTITGLTNTNLSGTAGIIDANLANITSAGKVANSATSATNTNTFNAIVSRDATGNFSAGTITATLIGNATNVDGIVGILNGGTGANTAIGAKTNFNLDLVDNTTDLNKPISTATQTELDLKAPLLSPNLTGIPSAPTAILGTNTTQIATTEFVMANAFTPDATTTTKGKIKLAGDLSGTADLPSVATGAIDNLKISPTAAIADTKLATISSLGKVLNSATTATNTNTINTIVSRDGTGNFSAGTITATLSGNATNVSGIVLGANGGTGIANTGKTITLDGNLTTSGAFATTLVSTAATNVTLPTTGTLATLAGTETLTGKTIAASSNTITGLTNTNLSGSAGISIANGGTGASTVIGIKTNLLLDLVDNTTDLNKPISSATQDALDLKAPLASPSLSGVPLAPTATLGTNSTQIATTAFVLENALTPDATTTTKGKIQLAGDLTGTADLPSVAPGAINNSKIANDANILDSKLATIVTDGKVANSATSATSANTINTIVARNSLGNFSAGTITANLTGNATNVTGVVLGVNGGTGVANTGKTINLGGNITTAGNFTTSGAFATTLVSTAATNVTLPITGTLATLIGTEIFKNKTISAAFNTISGLTNANLSPTAEITGDKLADDAVTEFKIANDAVTRDKILNDAVNTLKLANDAVTELKIQNDAVTEFKIANEAVTESKIAPISVTETKIASDAVTQTKIASNAISGDKIQINAITESKIEDNAVTEYKIFNGAITSVKIGTNAVTQTKIGSGAVTETKIGSGAVTETKIGSGAVTETKIGNDAVTKDKIKNTSVTYSKIQNVSANIVLGRAPGSSGIIQELTTSGSGSVILATSPTLFNPNLGTPSAINLTNATNIPLSQNKVTGVLSVSNGGTGATSLSGVLKGDSLNQIYSAEEGLDFSLVREVEDQTTASAGDITFYLSNQPNINSKVKMFISGKKALRGSFTINGTTVTYIPSNNNGYVILDNDVVEFVYYY